MDYVLKYSLLGGEPFIHGDLIPIISYLMDNYGEKTGRLCIITNGNIRPAKEVYDCLQKYNVMLAITDYTHIYDTRNNMNTLTKELDERNIEYSFNREVTWKDMGYPDNPAMVSEENAVDHFRRCGHSCYCFNDGKLYFCSLQYGAEKNTGYHTAEDDAISFMEYGQKHSMIETKERIFRYMMGEINEKGYPSFCRLCKGFGDDNQEYITAGS